MEACWQPDWRKRPNISVVVSRLREIFPFPSPTNAPSASDRSGFDQTSSHLVVRSPPLESPSLTFMQNPGFTPRIRSVLRMPTVSFHPLLNDQSVDGRSLSLDLSRNVFRPLLLDVTGRLSYTRPSPEQFGEYATDPAVRCMIISYDDILQWPIFVGPRGSDGRPLSGAGSVTLKDVLIAIFDSMRTQVTHVQA